MLTGTVFDEFNEPVPGANVYVKDKPGVGITTNIDGKFRLKVNIYDIVVVSFLGYENYEQRLTNKIDKVKVTLKPATENIDEVVVIYNHYKNTLIQEIKTDIVLPIENNDSKDSLTNYEFDGEVQEILNTALPIYIENTIYSYILDSKASEHAARMNSMKSATDNANDVIASLELLYNRARQAAITLELTDIVGGASVVNDN